PTLTLWITVKWAQLWTGLRCIFAYLVKIWTVAIKSNDETLLRLTHRFFSLLSFSPEAVPVSGGEDPPAPRCSYGRRQHALGPKPSEALARRRYRWQRSVETSRKRTDVRPRDCAEEDAGDLCTILVNMFQLILGSSERQYRNEYITLGMYYSFLLAHLRPSFIISRYFSTAYQALANCRVVSSSRHIKSNHLEQALEVLDLITPENTNLRGQESHVRLIQSCLEVLLETSAPGDHRMAQSDVHANFTGRRLDKLEENIAICEDSGVHLKYNYPFLFQELHKIGTRLDAAMVSGILSECGASGYFRSGLQLHALSVKTALDKFSPVGSALISLYSKCGYVEDAYQLFNEMSSRDTVLWTSIIAGYAQNWQVDTCLHLFVKMKQSTSKPNDYTLSSLLSACAGAGCLQLGKVVHCQEIQMGFDSYIHVSNALISMYAKCGSIDNALCIFNQMKCRDIISWNSMISAYAQHGLAAEGLDLLRQMETENFVPDAVTYVGVLSSCRHAGLVEQGRQCFNSMLAYGLQPEQDHYSCIVDLLGRAGLLEEALDFIVKMPIPANAVIWGSLLSSCRVHGNIWVGIRAAESRLLLEPACAVTHVQLANLYASIGDWKQTAKVRKCMKDKDVRTIPGCSWIEVGNEIHKFRAEDGSNSQVNEIILLLDALIDHMKTLDCGSEIKLELQEAAHE
ncbi:hypothetical protein Taro_021600, partial [Colocasia esculenta]|nr:hypothetical protein [Colocasia esculenta]